MDSTHGNTAKSIDVTGWDGLLLIAENLYFKTVCLYRKLENPDIYFKMDTIQHTERHELGQVL